MGSAEHTWGGWGKQHSCWISGTYPAGWERKKGTLPRAGGNTENQRGRGSTTTRHLEILSLQRRSVLWVFRRGRWVQDETQPDALSSFSPPLKNKPTPIPSCSQLVRGRHGSVGHHSTDLPSTQPIPSNAGQTVSHCLSQVFIPGLDHYFSYWCQASRGKTYLWATYQGIWLIRHPQTLRYLFKSASCYVTWQLLSPCVSPADKYL